MDGFAPLNLEQLKTAVGITGLNTMIENLFRTAAGDGQSVRVYNGYGTPEGNVAAGIGSLYLRKDGGAGTSIYRKESTTVATGWVPVITTILNYKMKVSSNDTTENYLLSKLAAGLGITLTETNDGGDEDATIAQSTDYGKITISIKDQTIDPALFPGSTLATHDIVIDNSRDWNGKKVLVTGAWGASMGVTSNTAALNPNIWESLNDDAHPLESYLPLWANSGSDDTSILEASIQSFWTAATSSEIFIAGVKDPGVGKAGFGFYLACDANGYLMARFKGYQVASGGGKNGEVTVAWCTAQEV